MGPAAAFPARRRPYHRRTPDSSHCASSLTVLNEPARRCSRTRRIARFVIVLIWPRSSSVTSYEPLWTICDRVPHDSGANDPEDQDDTHETSDDTPLNRKRRHEPECRAAKTHPHGEHDLVGDVFLELRLQSDALLVSRMEPIHVCPQVLTLDVQAFEFLEDQLVNSSLCQFLGAQLTS